MIKLLCVGLLVCGTGIGLQHAPEAAASWTEPDARSRSSRKARVIRSPKKASMYGALLYGIRLISQGKFDEWVDSYCHPTQCTTEKAVGFLKKMNLPALRRSHAKHCLRGKKKMSLKVTRIDKLPDGSRKIFVRCNPKGSPYPFRLMKDAKDKKKWKWVSA